MTGRGDCPNCGSALPANAPHGLCPMCLLGEELVTESPDEETAPPPVIGAAPEATTEVGHSPGTSPSSELTAMHSVHPGSDPHPGLDDLKSGTLLRYFGDYELLEVLGWGGMGSSTKPVSAA